MEKIVIAFFDEEGEILGRIQVELNKSFVHLKKKIIQDHIVYGYNQFDGITKIEIYEHCNNPCNDCKNKSC